MNFNVSLLLKQTRFYQFISPFLKVSVFKNLLKNRFGKYNCFWIVWTFPNDKSSKWFRLRDASSATLVGGVTTAKSLLRFYPIPINVPWHILLYNCFDALNHSIKYLNFVFFTFKVNLIDGCFCYLFILLKKYCKSLMLYF